MRKPLKERVKGEGETLNVPHAKCSTSNSYKRLDTFINNCTKCPYEAECAVNNWCLFDLDNPKCPNYEEGKKQYGQLKEDLCKNWSDILKEFSN